MDKTIIYTQAYNAEKTIKRTLESVLRQTSGDFFYYVLNNGSTDKTGAIISEYVKCDNRIILLENEVNNVWSKGNEWLGFLDKYSADHLFCTLDADDEYAPDFLAKMLQFMQKYDLEVAACGHDFIDAQTNKLTGVRKLEQDLILEGGGFARHLPQYHQYMRTIWGKIYSLSVVRKPSLTNYVVPGYGSDTLFAMKAFHNACRVGILAESLHRYYVSLKSVSYQFDSRRIASDKMLFEAAREFLISKCGAVSSENLNFLVLTYCSAVKDTLDVLIDAKLGVQAKLTYFLKVFQNPPTQGFINWPKNQQFMRVAEWVLMQEEVRSGHYLDEAAGILAALGIFPSPDSGLQDCVTFMLLARIRDKLAVIGAPYNVDAQIVSLAANSPLLTGLDAGFLTFFRDIVFSILQNDEQEALRKIYETIAQETDIPDRYAPAFLSLGLALAARLEHADEFVYFKKLRVSLLIDMAQLEDARIELADWDSLLPDDTDFKALRARLTQ